jgi:hypothetical protein
MSTLNSVKQTLLAGFGGGAGLSYFVGFILIVLGITALYYLYNYLYGMPTVQSTVVVGSAIPANQPTASQLYSIPPPYEGGEYSASFWTYITGWKDKAGQRKHILEIRGPSFSTLVVGLGVHKNNLVVRVHTKTAGDSAVAAPSGKPAVDPGLSVSQNTNLSTDNVKQLFAGGQVDQGLLETYPLCDLPSVDLQRWVHIAVILNGKTCDVYMDGKLARSCIMPSFYRVDPKGVQAKLLDFGGYDGNLSDVTFVQRSLNPDEIYRMYMSGPTTAGGGGSFLNWLANIFNVSGSLTLKTPQVNVTYSKSTLQVGS